jgi:hypothetical protein
MLPIQSLPLACTTQGALQGPRIEPAAAYLHEVDCPPHTRVPKLHTGQLTSTCCELLDQEPPPSDCLNSTSPTTHWTLPHNKACWLDKAASMRRIVTTAHEFHDLSQALQTDTVNRQHATLRYLGAGTPHNA